MEIQLQNNVRVWWPKSVKFQLSEKKLIVDAGCSRAVIQQQKISGHRQWLVVKGGRQEVWKWTTEVDFSSATEKKHFYLGVIWTRFVVTIADLRSRNILLNNQITKYNNSSKITVIRRLSNASF